MRFRLNPFSKVSVFSSVFKIFYQQRIKMFLPFLKLILICTDEHTNRHCNICRPNLTQIHQRGQEAFDICHPYITDIQRCT